MADDQTDSLLDAALDTSKDDDSYVLDEHSGEEGDGADDAVRVLLILFSLQTYFMYNGKYWIFGRGLF